MFLHLRLAVGLGAFHKIKCATCVKGSLRTKSSKDCRRCHNVTLILEGRTGEGSVWLRSLRRKIILREAGFVGNKWTELGKGRAQELAVWWQ